MIPFNNLKPIFRNRREEYMNVIEGVMASGVYLMGPELAAFEREFADYLLMKHVVGVGSGTDALTLAIRGLGLGQDDEVIAPANAYPTAFGIAAAGVRLRLCDVDENTLNVSVKTLEAAITNRTKAIVAVHLYGLPAPMVEIMKLARKRNLLVIEDCAQAVGAKIDGKNTGTFGDVSCFSFYPTKNLGAMGDGGAVVTNNTKLAERIRRLRMYGEDKRYHSVEFSTHSRLDEIQSAILRVRLKYLEEELITRQKLADRYRREFSDEVLVPQIITDEVRHANHLFVIRLKDREKIRSSLKRIRIETAVHYPAPVHLVSAFADLGYRRSDFPVAEAASKEVLSLPFYTGLNSVDLKRIILAVGQGVSLKEYP